MTADALPGALNQDNLFALAANQAEPLAVLRLTESDIEEQWTTPQLRTEVATRRLTDIVPIDDDTRYCTLRTAVQMWIEADWDLRDDLTPSQADGEVLYALWRLLHEGYPCSACFQQASRIDQMQPDGECAKHMQAVA